VEKSKEETYVVLPVVVAAVVEAGAVVESRVIVVVIVVNNASKSMVSPSATAPLIDSTIMLVVAVGYCGEGNIGCSY